MKTTTIANPISEGASCFRFPSISEFNIAEFRASTGLSQSDFASLHGVSLSSLKKWEKQRAAPKVASVVSLIDAWIVDRLKPISA